MEDIELGRLVIRSCTGKRRLNLKKAENEIDYYAAKNVLMFYYHCPFCYKYHLTHSPPKPALAEISLKARIDKFNEVPVLKKKHK
jgi:hypothetical protein